MQIFFLNATQLSDVLPEMKITICNEPYHGEDEHE